MTARHLPPIAHPSPRAAGDKMPDNPIEPLEWDFGSTACAAVAAARPAACYRVLSSSRDYLAVPAPLLFRESSVPMRRAAIRKASPRRATRRRHGTLEGRGPVSEVVHQPRISEVVAQIGLVEFPGKAQAKVPSASSALFAGVSRLPRLAQAAAAVPQSRKSFKRSE